MLFRGELLQEGALLLLIHRDDHQRRALAVGIHVLDRAVCGLVGGLVRFLRSAPPAVGDALPNRGWASVTDDSNSAATPNVARVLQQAMRDS